MNSTNNIRIFCTIAILISAIPILPSGFAQSTNLSSPAYMTPSGNPVTGTGMTIATDKTSYNYGDKITISGTVQEHLSDTPLTVIIKNSAGIVAKVDQLQVAPDMTFSDTFTPTGNSWQTGTYLVYAQYGSQYISAKTTFQFTGSATASSTMFTVNTDKNSYVAGDTIVISGQVPIVSPDTPLNIQILDPKTNLIAVDQMSVNPDGSYSKSFSTNTPLWKNNGVYTVRVQYGLPNVTTQTTFSFTSQLAPISSVFQITEPMTQLVISSVQYTISGGTVRDMSINRQNNALFVTISSTTDGTITLQLPRTLIDARTGSGQDAEFNTLIDGVLVKPQSESSDLDYRILTMPFVQGEQVIEIEGTTIISSQIQSQSLGGGNVPVYITYGSGSSQGCVLTNNCYSPDVLHILPGQTITWTNNDTVGHTATSGHPSDITTGEIFDSSLIAAGSTYTSPAFGYNGTYPYFDRVHTWITGVIIVGNGISSQSSASPPTVQNVSPPTLPVMPCGPNPCPKICGDHPCTSGEANQTSPITSPASNQNTPPSITSTPTTSPKIPAWVKSIFIWYGRGSISDDELIGAIQFLVQQGIIHLK